jgi:hypothetical protein
MRRANCIGADTIMFFPSRGTSTSEARHVFAGCVVAVECLEYARTLGDRSTVGIWGGLSAGTDVAYVACNIAPERAASIGVVSSRVGSDSNVRAGVRLCRCALRLICRLDLGARLTPTGRAE